MTSILVELTVPPPGTLLRRIIDDSLLLVINSRQVFYPAGWVSYEFCAIDHRGMIKEQLLEKSDFDRMYRVICRT